MDRTYDLILKGGRLIDPLSEIDKRCDVGITEEKVTFVGDILDTANAKKVMDLSQHIICPGLIDMHVHIGKHMSEIGVPADIAGVFSGVTTVCDAGSAGYKNFNDLLSNDIKGNRTEVFSLINLCPDGLHILPEKWDIDELLTEAVIEVISSNMDIIRGLKLRATGDFINKIGMKGIVQAKDICRQTGLPLMVHVGMEPGETAEIEISRFTRDMLDCLETGDIVSHAFTAKDGGPIRPDGTCDESLLNAAERGVLLDTAIARTNFSIKIFQIAMDRGFLPNIISTDLCTLNIEDTVFNLSYTMSKFHALGLPLPDIVKMTSLNPALALGINAGCILQNAVADFTILSLQDCDFQYNDGPWGNQFQGAKLIVPIFTIKKGEVIIPKVCENFTEGIRDGSLGIKGIFY